MSSGAQCSPVGQAMDFPEDGPWWRRLCTDDETIGICIFLVHYPIGIKLGYRCIILMGCTMKLYDIGIYWDVFVTCRPCKFWSMNKMVMKEKQLVITGGCFAFWSIYESHQQVSSSRSPAFLFVESTMA